MPQIDEGSASNNRVYLEKLRHAEYRLHARRHTYSLMNAARRSTEVMPGPRGLGANAWIIDVSFGANIRLTWRKNQAKNPRATPGGPRYPTTKHTTLHNTKRKKTLSSIPTSSRGRYRWCDIVGVIT